MARLGIAPHVADKVLKIIKMGDFRVAAVYQRHDFPCGTHTGAETMGCARRTNHGARNQRRKRYPESCMSELVPMGYLSRLEAVDVIVRSLVAGTPDGPT